MPMEDPVSRARALLAKATKGPLYAVEGGEGHPPDGLYGSDHGWKDGEYTKVPVYTVSRDPERAGWDTDGGCEGYGIAQPDAELWAAAPTLLAELADEVERLRERNGELLALVAKVSQETPLPDEVANALNQRGVLLAKVGSLEAELRELKDRIESERFDESTRD